MGHEDAKNKPNTKDPYLKCERAQEKNLADIATPHKHLKGVNQIRLNGGQVIIIFSSVPCYIRQQLLIDGRQMMSRTSIKSQLQTSLPSEVDLQFVTSVHLHYRMSHSFQILLRCSTCHSKTIL